jgi:hypothetical protein
MLILMKLCGESNVMGTLVHGDHVWGGRAVLWDLGGSKWRSTMVALPLWSVQNLFLGIFCGQKWRYIDFGAILGLNVHSGDVWMAVVRLWYFFVSKLRYRRVASPCWSAQNFFFVGVRCPEVEI